MTFQRRHTIRLSYTQNVSPVGVIWFYRRQGFGV